MILIIADRHDHAAQWLADRLSARSPRTGRRVALVTPLQLACSTRIVHRLSTGACSASFDLADGTRLDFAAVTGVINRMAAMPTGQLASASPQDRDYAEGEWHAFLLGWLASLPCPVLNPPSPEWLAGTSRSVLATRHLAAAAGLAIEAGAADDPAMLEPSMSHPAGTAHFACEGQLVGPIVDRATREAMLTFAAAYGSPLLQIDTAPDERGARRLVGATVLVDFARGGPALVAAIERALAA